MSSTRADEKPVHIISLDFDGILGDKELGDKLRELDSDPQKYQKLAEFIAKHEQHKAFFQSLFTDPNAEYVLMVGSNRQNWYTDFNNGQNAKKGACGSCFPIFEALPQALEKAFGVQMTLDKTLYADTLLGRDVGHSFSDVETQPNADTKKADANANDPKTNMSKVDLLFFQMQHVAKKYPDQQIRLSFADDVPTLIIAPLYNFYKKHPELIPPNVTLDLSLHNKNKTPEELKKDLEGALDEEHRASVTVTNDFLQMPPLTSSLQPGQNPADHLATFIEEESKKQGMLMDYGLKLMLETQSNQKQQEALQLLQDYLTPDVLRTCEKTSGIKKIGLFHSGIPIQIDDEKVYVSGRVAKIYNLLNADDNMSAKEKLEKIHDFVEGALDKKEMKEAMPTYGPKIAYETMQEVVTAALDSKKTHDPLPAIDVQSQQEQKSTISLRGSTE